MGKPIRTGFSAAALSVGLAVTACGNAQGFASTQGLKITVSGFDRQGPNVDVSFSAYNPTSTALRWDWAQLVLTAPDGTRHTTVSEQIPGPSYELVEPGGTYSGFETLPFSARTHGHFSISYGGRLLQEKDL
jgi:hypothetical protein